MGDAVKEKAEEKSFFKGLKAEFKKIIWPEKTPLRNRLCWFWLFLWRWA